MRLAASLIALACGTAAADDGVRASGSIGAGGQGTSTYGAVGLSVDVLWRDIQLVLGGRAVWEDGVFRARDWDRAADAVSLVRHLEARTKHLAIAAGALAPSDLGRVTDGTRQALDDTMRTGARGAVTTDRVQASLEIDDVLDPALTGGAVRVQLATPWTLHGAAAVDPTVLRSAIEAGGARRWDAKARRLELGASLVVEPRVGVGVVGFGRVDVEHAGARWSVRADLRGGNGTNGAAFGPLHRAERAGDMALLDDARAGFGAGLAASMHADAGWVTAGVRARPGMGTLVTAAAGAPMSRFVQAAGWLAATPDVAAGAAAVRVTWARHVFSTFEAARMIRTDEHMATPAWSLTAWFGATLE